MLLKNYNFLGSDSGATGSFAPDGCNWSLQLVAPGRNWLQLFLQNMEKLQLVAAAVAIWFQLWLQPVATAVTTKKKQLQLNFCKIWFCKFGFANLVLQNLVAIDFQLVLQISYFLINFAFLVLRV